MSDDNKQRFIPALRRAGETRRGDAFAAMGKEEISGAELRAFVQKSIDSRSEQNRSVRDWNLLSPEAKAEAWVTAFPEATYRRAATVDEGVEGRQR